MLSYGIEYTRNPVGSITMPTLESCIAAREGVFSLNQGEEIDKYNTTGSTLHYTTSECTRILREEYIETEEEQRKNQMLLDRIYKNKKQQKHIQGPKAPS